MKRFLLVLLVLFLALPAGGRAIIAQENKARQAVILSLKSMNEKIPAGTAPAFRLTIENAGTADESILKPRGDLQDTYYDLVVMKDGKTLDLPRAISDPGPISKEDFVVLGPREKAAFEFSRYAVAVDRLPAGKYEARIRFWQDPCKSRTTSTLSPAATFTVEN
jgi:hypothetical protein